jgi:hypothetical protein
MVITKKDPNSNHLSKRQVNLQLISVKQSFPIKQSFSYIKKLGQLPIMDHLTNVEKILICYVTIVSSTSETSSFIHRNDRILFIWPQKITEIIHIGWARKSSCWKLGIRNAPIKCLLVCIIYGKILHASTTIWYIFSYWHVH